jgi:hypothetical protein
MNVLPVAWQYAVNAGKANEWRSDWCIMNHIGGARDAVHSDFMLPIDKAIYERAKDSPVQITGFFDMLLIENRRIQLHNRDYIQGIGVCYPGANTDCDAPWHCAEFTMWPSLGADLSPVRWSCGLDQPPIRNGEPQSTPDASPFAYLERGYIRRSFTFNNVHLQDYLKNR